MVIIALKEEIYCFLQKLTELKQLKRREKPTILVQLSTQYSVGAGIINERHQF